MFTNLNINILYKYTRHKRQPTETEFFHNATIPLSLTSTNLRDSFFLLSFSGNLKKYIVPGGGGGERSSINNNTNTNLEERSAYKSLEITFNHNFFFKGFRQSLPREEEMRLIPRLKSLFKQKFKKIFSRLPQVYALE
jgi:hypothetical protein